MPSFKNSHDEPLANSDAQVIPDTLSTENLTLLPNQRLYLITEDLDLKLRLTAILHGLDLLEPTGDGSLLAEASDVIFVVDARKKMPLLPVLRPFIALVDSSPQTLTRALFEAGCLEMIPVALLSSPEAVKFFVDSALQRCLRLNQPEAYEGVAGSFAADLIHAEGDLTEIGEAIIKAARACEAVSANFYLIEQEDLMLLAEFNSATGPAAKSRISIAYHQPFSVALNGRKPLWYSDQGILPAETSHDQENLIIGIYPCYDKDELYGLLRICFSGAAKVSLAVQQQIAEWLKLAAPAIKQSQSLENLQQQKNVANILLGVTSHDLRSPLFTMQVVLELLRIEEDPSIRETAIGNLTRAINQAGSIVEDLLDFTRLQLTHAIPINPLPVAMDAIIDNTLRDLKLKAPHRKVELKMSGNMEGQWDKARLNQIFTNLLENAHKYTPAQECLSVSIDAQEEKIYIQIKNRGTVIPLEKINILFEPMIRAEENKKNLEGLGLGLYIVRHLVEAHQGRVWATSDTSTGTVFNVELPRIAPSNSQPLGSAKKRINGYSPKNEAGLDSPVAFPLGMKDQCCQYFYQLWVNLCRQHQGLPHPSSLPQERIDGFSHDLCWVNVIEKKKQVIYRFEKVGSGLVHKLGRNLAGTEVNAQDLDSNLADYLCAYHRACTTKAPDFMYINYRLGYPEPGRFEKLVLPFSRGIDEKVTDLISIVRFISWNT